MTQPPRLRPMLASSGPIPGDADEWAFEPKWDGWRAVVTVAAGRLVVRTRTGRDVTEAVPELAGVADAVAGSAVVLDGELVAHDGQPGSFYRLGPRMAARRPLAPSRRTPVTFIAFDVLWHDGDLCRASYTARRAVLESLDFTGPAWSTSPTFPGDGAELFAACTQLGLEGLMAKRLASRYRCGERSPDWVKAKTTAWKTQHAGYRHEH